MTKAKASWLLYLGVCQLAFTSTLVRQALPELEVLF